MAEGVENRYLKLKLQAVLGKLFGRSSEKISPDQLALEFGVDSVDPETPEAEAEVEEVVIEPEEVLANPEAFRRIGEEVTEELDVVPTKFFKRRIVRPKYVRKADRSLPPVVAPAPKRIIENSYASAGLLASIMLAMIYEAMREEIRACTYLQIDETPVRYQNPGSGKCGQGYLWPYHAPGKAVFFEWHTGRASECLDQTLKGFEGTVQNDFLRREILLSRAAEPLESLVSLVIFFENYQSRSSWSSFLSSARNVRVVKLSWKEQLVQNL